LIVEDDESVAVTLRGVLEYAGYDVDEAADIQSAAARLQERHFDLVVLDLRLGHEDGLDFLQYLRKVSPGTLALILTGYGSLETAVRAIREGAIDYLLKPAEPEELIASVARGLDRRNERVEAELHRFSFLAEAGEVLASSLDYEATLRAVARLIVPRLADWCAIDAVTEEGGQRRVIALLPDPAKLELAQTVERRYPVDPDAPYGVPMVLRTGDPVLYPEVTAPLLETIAVDDEHLRLLREMGLSSVMIVPMVVRGVTLGAISFIAAESGRRYREQDLALARELGLLAALAIENARLYRGAQEAIQLRNDFVLAVTHDLKNPLAAIKMQVQLLSRRLLRGQITEKEALADALLSIDQATTRLAGQVQDLVDIARRDTGAALELTLQPVDLVQLVKQAAGDYQRATDSHQIEVRAGEPAIVGLLDRARMERVLANLLENAIKYSPDGGGITLTLEREQDGTATWAVLAVSDHGVGIPTADLPRVFERFHRAANAGAWAPGSGVGLASVQRIIDQHGGTIAVVSTEGEGSTFTIRLPLSE
jgi:signal transduction histidine kinase